VTEFSGESLNQALLIKVNSDIDQEEDGPQTRGLQKRANAACRPSYAGNKGRVGDRSTVLSAERACILDLCGIWTTGPGD
jgi:hypothetical protein